MVKRFTFSVFQFDRRKSVQQQRIIREAAEGNYFSQLTGFQISESSSAFNFKAKNIEKPQLPSPSALINVSFPSKCAPPICLHRWPIGELEIEEREMARLLNTFYDSLVRIN
jgi:hypothetical protein